MSSAPPFELAPLEHYLQNHVPNLGGPLQLERFDAGQSNPTFLVRAGAERLVLRKKPAGALLPSAHAVEREYRVLAALADSAVPVPRVVCLCEDASVIGTPFYLMEYVQGRLFWDPTLPECSQDERRAMIRDITRVLGALHDVDLARVGLDDYGKPGNYFERQVARWSKQYRASETGRIESMERLLEWLPAHLPPDSGEVALLHGDFRLDNLVFHPSEPRVVAVLDWELSTLGDPLADLAYYAMSWHFAPGEFRGMAGADLAALGIPDERCMLQRYAEQRGKPAPDPARFRFALVCSMFRLAAILQGVLARALQGNAAASNAEATGRGATLIADVAWNLAKEGTR